MKYLNFILAFISFLGTAHWYVGCEKISLLDRIYKRRLGISTSYKLAKHWLK